MTIKDWPEQEKPRERLFSLGPSALSEAELLAILLGTGNPEETALDLAKRLLLWGTGQYGPGMGFLKESSMEELMSLPGIGPAKAARLKACLEISKRLQKVDDCNLKSVCLRSGRDVYEFMKGDVEELDREHFCVIMVNVRNQVIAKEVVSVGGLNAAIVHPREIFKNCIKKSAAAVILVHNHPSGEPAPSDEDVAVTKRIIEAGRIVGIDVLDHVIVGHGQYISLRESFKGWFTW